MRERREKNERMKERNKTASDSKRADVDVFGSRNGRQ